MVLTPEQINELLSIIHTNQAIIIGKQLGLEYLSEYDKSLLEASGVDVLKLYNPAEDSIFTAFHFGMLAESLENVKALNKLTYQNLKDYIKDGKYIPETELDKRVIQRIKNQTYSDVKKNAGNIFQDVNGILDNKSQETFLKEEIEEGLKQRKTVREIASEIARKSGDWNRNFERIVDFQVNSAYQEGRVSMAEKNGSQKVWKKVFNSACSHCIRLYLTNGFGSEPKLFDINELRSNGTNIGRKVDDWKPVVGSTHPHCFRDPNTPIYTSTGWKKISQIQVGDLVLTHKKRFRKVTSLIFTERDLKEEYDFKVRVPNTDRTVTLRRITGEHPILTGGGMWKQAKDVVVGDKFHLLFDKCTNPNCKSILKGYGLYYRDNRDVGKSKYCSQSCGNKHFAELRTDEQKKQYTQKAREACKSKYPNFEHLHTEEVRKKSALANATRNPSYIELRLRYLLDKLEVEYQVGQTILSTELDSKGRKKYWYPDIFIPSLNIILEADGENWHDEEKDRLRDEDIKKSCGADVFRFTEHELRNHLDEVEKELVRILKNHRGEYFLKHVEVVSVKRKSINQKVKLYNFSVEEDESYIANGIVVHNCRCLIFSHREGYLWNPETQDFDIPPKEIKEQRKRKPIRVKIAGKEMYV